jgi:putative nucleotidyltransferase with HDIG domain
VVIFEANLQKEPIVVRNGERLPERFYPHLDRKQIRDLARRDEPWLLREVDESPLEGVSITMPLLCDGEAIGMLTLARRLPSPGYTQSDAQLLRVFGIQIALGMLHARTHERMSDAFRDLKQASLSAVRALFEALGTFDRYTRDHSERVSRYARMLGEAISLPPDQIELLSMGGLLHDIGKLGVTGTTLNKNAHLTSDETDRFRLHPVSGARILAGVDALVEIVPIVLHHHERYDGEGYPGRLAGEEIPLKARIIAVVDTYDSMNSDRPYRSALARAHHRRGGYL